MLGEGLVLWKTNWLPVATERSPRAAPRACIWVLRGAHRHSCARTVRRSYLMAANLPVLARSSRPYLGIPKDHAGGPGGSRNVTVLIQPNQ